MTKTRQSLIFYVKLYFVDGSLNIVRTNFLSSLSTLYKATLYTITKGKCCNVVPSGALSEAWPFRLPPFLLQNPPPFSPPCLLTTSVCCALSPVSILLHNQSDLSLCLIPNGGGTDSTSVRHSGQYKTALFGKVHYTHGYMWAGA